MKASEFGIETPQSLGSYCYARSEDGDGDGIWHNSAADRESAIWEAVEDASVDGVSPSYVYVAECLEFQFSVPDADDVIEQMKCEAYDQCGEAAEDWLSNISNISKETEAELTLALRDVVSGWLTKHGLWPMFCSLGKIQRVAVATPEGETVAGSP